MAKKFAIFTGNRAEFGILERLAKKIYSDNSVILQLIVSGSHLSNEYGRTISEIEASGLPISERIPLSLPDDEGKNLSDSLAECLPKFTGILTKLRPDILIILGDRWEAFGIALAAQIQAVPIAHIHGGELTFGSLDNYFRHSITLASTFHFAANEQYAKRIVQLGKNPNTVFVCGAPSLESLESVTLLNREEVSEKLGLKCDEKFFVATIHPETVGPQCPAALAQMVCEALSKFPEYAVIFTHPNSDHGSAEIIKVLHAAIKTNKNFKLVKSLGMTLYKSAVYYSAAVVGNSSSGIIEAPSLQTPTVNVGSRQSGRLSAKSVFNALPSVNSIENKILCAIEHSQSADAEFFENPYGSGRSSDIIFDILKNYDYTITPEFFDLPERGLEC